MRLPEVYVKGNNVRDILTPSLLPKPVLHAAEQEKLTLSASLSFLHRLNTYEFPKKSSSTRPRRKRTSRATSAAAAAAIREATMAVAVAATEAVEVVAVAVVGEVVAGDSETMTRMGFRPGGEQRPHC